MTSSLHRSTSSPTTATADASNHQRGRGLHDTLSAALALAWPHRSRASRLLWLLTVGAVFAFASAFVSGCTKPQLDTSNAGQFETSVNAVRTRLPSDARAEFDAALLSLTAAAPESPASGKNRSEDSSQRPPFDALSPSLRAQLQGRTGREVIAIATKLRKEREARRLKAEALERERKRQSALSELRGLRAKLDAFDLETLRGLSVTKARLLASEVDNDEIDPVKDWFAIDAPAQAGQQAQSGPVPEIELEIESRVRDGIYAVLFDIELFKLDEAQPWRRFQTKQRFSRGLFFGQTATRRLVPEAFADLFATDAAERPPGPDEVVLVVRPVLLFGADGEAFAGAEISDAELNRVQQLINDLSKPEPTVALASAKNNGTATTASAGSDQEDQSGPSASGQAADLALAAQVDAVRRWRTEGIARAYRAEAEAIRAERRAAETRHAPFRQFLIEQARFHWSDSTVHRKPVITLQVHNGTSETITSCACRGRLSSDDRARPWVDAGFEHRLREGLAPGETRKLRILPNWLGPWGAGPKDRDDLVLEVEATRLDGNNQKDLFAYDFPAQRDEQLARLEALIVKRGW